MGISLIKIENKIGLRTEPCGTPAEMGWGSEILELNLTVKERLSKN
jgi:hypothetical protein